MQMEASEAALVPLFQGRRAWNITFVLDSSENTRAVLGSVKRLLIQTLLTKASLRDSLFNIVTYSNKVNCWSHHMLPCASDTVYAALSWIHSISCSPGRDLLAALSMALTDPACHAVHLLCTGLPEQPEALLRTLPALAAGKPVNGFYLQDSVSYLDRNTRDFLQSLTQATGGSCYLIAADMNGVLQKAIPLHVAESQSSGPAVSPAKRCCVSASVVTPHPHHTSSPLLRCSLGDLIRPVSSCALSGQNTDSPEFFPGCRVLARREVDGLYYLGSVIQQVQDRRGVWVVEFDQSGSAGLGAVSSQRQLVCSLDMVSDSRTHRHCVVPGDVVLSPWEPDGKRFGPGRVVAAVARRNGFGEDAVTILRVLMWNSYVTVVPDSVVLSISASHHERIVRELQILVPTPSQYCSQLYSCSPSCTTRLFYSDYCQSSPTLCCCPVTNHCPCIVPTRCEASLGRTNGFNMAEQDKHVRLSDTDVGKSDPEVPSSSSSSSSSSSVLATVKLRSKQQRPPWRYWKRTGPEPQHRQPGNAVARRTSQPLRFSFPVPQISASPNHSSLFQSLPDSRGRRANIRDGFGTTNFKPRPPPGLRSLSGNNVTTVYT
ncbi:uncharacterized protein C11orf16 homolog [Mugil cephalus]|uniref:uncharacterized protein C11orf16 homolog n=1 Tax=Mugil cephalus TaxID=48193 RepID=UPI001FB7C350|nr:uncharacterized protein C11orf16 homolog [Mugil cephalus]